MIECNPSNIRILQTWYLPNGIFSIIKIFKKFISSKGRSKKNSNMFRTLVNYYSKYQNSYVKHNEAVIEEYIEFTHEMTSSFMNI